MDQSISLAGFAFDRATFKYNGTSSFGLIEVVDNITFEQQAAAVPEPGTLALLGIGLAAAGRRLRRRQQ